MADRLQVRKIHDDEGKRLLRIIRRGRGSVVTWRRAQMVLLSARCMPVAKIAEMTFTADRVRDVIHNFNADVSTRSTRSTGAGGRGRSRCPSAGRCRTKVTRGAGSAAAALAMVFKLVESAQQRWWAVNAAHLVALVRAGARFEGGVLVADAETLAARGGRPRWPRTRGLRQA